MPDAAVGLRIPADPLQAAYRRPPAATLAEMENDTVTTEAPATTATVEAPIVVEDELLVEEISIDGMCGVY